jgi:hypothetical protein
LKSFHGRIIILCIRLGELNDLFLSYYLFTVKLLPTGRTTISPTTTGIPEVSNTPDGCTLVQFIDFSDPPSFSTVLCQLIDDARPVQLRRSPARNASSAITFNSKTVSRRHAALWSEEGQVFILDQHSTHGTYLNGDRLVPGRTSENAKVLIDGDTLRLGAVDERAAIRGITAKLRILRIAW